jgi:diketogulonate reductase-like aldo/keto reductase
VRSIGVSNYSIEVHASLSCAMLLTLAPLCVQDYQELMGDSRTKITPAVNQIELNPLLYRQKTVDLFR